MRNVWMGSRVVSGLALAAVLMAMQGCTYLRNRGRDANDMFDVGFTFSRKPQFAAYTNCPVIFPIGYGKVDGRFVGVGGRKAGVMEHKESSTGLSARRSENYTRDVSPTYKQSIRSWSGLRQPGSARMRHRPGFDKRWLPKTASSTRPSGGRFKTTLCRQRSSGRIEMPSRGKFAGS